MVEVPFADQLAGAMAGMALELPINDTLMAAMLPAP